MQVRLKRWMSGFAALAVVAALGACTGADSPVGAPTTTSQRRPATTSGPAVTPSSAPSAVGATPAATAATVASARPLPPGLTRADVRAGLLSAKVVNAGSGRLVTVPGNVRAASRRGTAIRVKVQVERGLKVNGPRFATFVMATLNDSRSWGHGGGKHFDRVDEGRFDFRVVLASPTTSARMCRPLRTYGRLSCHRQDASILTVYRWVKAIPDYGKDRTSYREYLVNHEVGHALGHDHEYCAGRGKRAPVMQQQTKGLQGCRVNPWPFP